MIQRKGGSDKEYKLWWRSILESGQMVESVGKGRLEVKCLKNTLLSNRHTNI
jgi:hypothetical protein